MFLPLLLFHLLSSVLMRENFHKTYSLPEPPFHVYFLRNSEVFPKRLYTVTGVCRQKDRVTLFILELTKVIDFDDRYVRVVEGFSVN